jgi:hypothetical protein
MGLEAQCTARLDRRRSQGKARLEATDLRFRGEFRLDIPFSKMRAVRARDGVLRIETGEGVVALELGSAAEKWADKILHPKSVLDKLGVKSGQVVSVIGVDDAGFLPQVQERGAEVVSGRPRKDSDLIFFAVDKTSSLGRLEVLKRSIRPEGAVWVVWAKGRQELKEDHVRAAALRVGLTDVKVVAFSSTHSALKLVIPLRDR